MPSNLILVVEDNEKNRKLICDVLRVKGFNVMEAESAEHGLELASTQAPALVVMDIHLPGMNGIEALAKMRALPSPTRIPTIAFTASVMPMDQQQIISAGFDALISKPVSLKALLSTITSLIGKDAA